MSASTESTVFGRYRLLDLIAKGGMAEVFRAKLDGAAGTEKQLCIKRILPRLSSNSEFISLFVEEARIALPLTHGNITQVFDFGEVSGVYFLAMEYIRGQNLAQVLARIAEGGKPMDVVAALFVAGEVCRGLQYAHSYTDGKGKSVVVVHRDVSPHNVLISYNGEVKLTDFGIARAASKAAETEAVVRGKPCYVSPEQADGAGGDPRSDIFSLGTVLYEMLTGVRPFEGETDNQTLERVRACDVTPPSKLNPAVDAELDAIVRKAMARDPAERYQRAGDLQVDLSKVLHRLAPEFTAERLAELVKELFAWELAQMDKEGQDGGGRDRLLFQLSRAGVQVEDKNADTGELLQMGTVALDAKPMPAPGRGRLVAVVAVALVLLAAGVSVALGLVGKGDAASDAGGPSVALSKLPKEDPTEHITPKSLRRPQQALTPAAPAAGTGEGTAAGGAVGSGKGTAAAKPAVAKTPRRVVRKSATRYGYLNCNSWPWSVVYLDGRRLRGNTPLYRVKVTAGRHRIKFVNPELGLSKEVSVTVDPCKRATGKDPGSAESCNIRTVAVSLQQ